jgi:UDP-GlcNAc3NAcA epimerase
MKTVVTVVGARPQFIKAAAVSRELARTGQLRELLVHTGQHYDSGLSNVFFSELRIPKPAHYLDIGSGTHGAQTGDMLKAIERVLLSEKPDALLVYGDTNSTLAGALAAAKLHIPVAHVEAGLRSFNRHKPEELNRVVADHVAALLFCPTQVAVAHLAAEGVTSGVHHTGDVMYDVALEVGSRADTESKFRTSGLEHKRFVLATVHRAENTDDPARLEAILNALARVSERLNVVLPLHPRTSNVLISQGKNVPGGVRVIDPVGIVDMTWLERHAALIVTDSGGVQKEAYFHRTPCITVNTETEWVETVEAGWNRLADPSCAEAIVAAAFHALETALPTAEIRDYGTGTAAKRVVEILSAFLS